MKAHERKAVDRAVEWTAQTQYDVERIEQTVEERAHESVRLAMFRAGRVYDRETQAEAFRYAMWLLGHPVKVVEVEDEWTFADEDE